MGNVIVLPYQHIGGDVVIKSKTFLMIVGILVLLMGILGAVPGLDYAKEPMWHAIIKILIGLAALVVAYMDKS